MKTQTIVIIGAIGAGIAYLAYRSGYLTKAGIAASPTKAVSQVTSTAKQQTPSNTIPEPWAAGYRNLTRGLGASKIAPVFEDKTYRMSETRSGVITAQEQPNIAPTPIITSVISRATIPQHGAIMGGQPVNVITPEPIAYTPSVDYFRKRPLAIAPPPISEVSGR
jgi:hypothetical protein